MPSGADAGRELACTWCGGPVAVIAEPPALVCEGHPACGASWDEGGLVASRPEFTADPDFLHPFFLLPPKEIHS